MVSKQVPSWRAMKERPASALLSRQVRTARSSTKTGSKTLPTLGDCARNSKVARAASKKRSAALGVVEGDAQVVLSDILLGSGAEHQAESHAERRRGCLNSRCTCAS